MSSDLNSCYSDLSKGRTASEVGTERQNVDSYVIPPSLLVLLLTQKSPLQNRVVRGCNIPAYVAETNRFNQIFKRKTESFLVTRYCRYSKYYVLHDYYK